MDRTALGPSTGTDCAVSVDSQEGVLLSALVMAIPFRLDEPL